jgi:hypothetical protein
MAFSTLLAVSTCAVELAKVVDGEAVDSDGSSSVVLDDLVLGSGSAAASN